MKSPKLQKTLHILKAIFKSQMGHLFNLAIYACVFIAALAAGAAFGWATPWILGAAGITTVILAGPIGTLIKKGLTKAYNKIFKQKSKNDIIREQHCEIEHKKYEIGQKDAVIEEQRKTILGLSPAQALPRGRGVEARVR